MAVVTERLNRRQCLVVPLDSAHCYAPKKRNVSCEFSLRMLRQSNHFLSEDEITLIDLHFVC